MRLNARSVLAALLLASLVCLLSAQTRQIPQSAPTGEAQTRPATSRPKAQFHLYLPVKWTSFLRKTIERESATILFPGPGPARQKPDEFEARPQDWDK